MNLHQLRIFEAVGRHLNITSAAHELHMSQPAVSSQLKSLEQEYGAKFYKRNNHGMEITWQGQEFLDALRPVLAQVDALEARFKIGRARGKSAVLVLGGSHTLSVTVLPEILVDFRKRHPEIKLVVETSHSRVMESRVQNGEVEIALITAPTYLPACEYEPYIEHQAVAFVPPDHPLAGRPASLEKLVRQPLVVRRGSSSVKELARRGYSLNIAAECDAPEAVKSAVLGGLGIGVLFRSRVDPEIRRGEVAELEVPALNEIKTRSFIIYGKHRSLSSGAREFLQTVRRRKLRHDKDATLRGKPERGIPQPSTGRPRVRPAADIRPAR
jgi:DNA-binding transcriptional LysR family regulator